MKKKILILIHSDIYIRNYLETNAFDILIKKYNCHFVAISNDVYNKKVLNKKIKKNFLSYVSYSKQELINFQKYLYKNFLLNKENSRTINYLKKIILKPKLYWYNEKIYLTITKFPIRIISWVKKNIEFLYIKIFYNKNFIKNPNSQLEKIYKKVNPDLIIFPLQDAHLSSFDLLQINKTTKTLGLIDNWDNLSSRPTHQLKPRFITVWGEQTKVHAVKFQKYKKKKFLFWAHLDLVNISRTET